jgi:hypothetical protein
LQSLIFTKGRENHNANFAMSNSKLSTPAGANGKRPREHGTPPQRSYRTGVDLNAIMGSMTQLHGSRKKMAGAKGKRPREHGTPPQRSYRTGVDLNAIMGSMTQLHGSRKKMANIAHTDEDECLTFSAGIAFTKQKTPQMVSNPVHLTFPDGSVKTVTKKFMKCANPDCVSDERSFAMTHDGFDVCNDCGVCQTNHPVACQEAEYRIFEDDDASKKRAEVSRGGFAQTVVTDSRLKHVQSMAVDAELTCTMEAIHSRALALGVDKKDIKPEPLQDAAVAFNRSKHAIRDFVMCFRCSGTAQIEQLGVEFGYKIFAATLLHRLRCTQAVACSFNMPRYNNPMILAACLVNVALIKANHDSALIMDSLKLMLVHDCGVSAADVSNVNQCVMLLKRLANPPFICAHDFDPSAALASNSEGDGTLMSASAYPQLADKLDVPLVLGLRAKEVAHDWKTTQSGGTAHPSTIMAVAMRVAWQEMISGTARCIEAKQINSKVLAAIHCDAITVKIAADAVGINEKTVQVHADGMGLPTASKSLEWIFRDLVAVQDDRGAVVVPANIMPNSFLKVDIWRSGANVKSASFYDWTRQYHPSVIAAVALYRAFESMKVDAAPYDAEIKKTLTRLGKLQETHILSNIDKAIAECEAIKKNN